MKSAFLRMIAGLVLLVGVLLWLRGGARAGFYRTYYEVTRVDEITGLTYPAERVEALLPGIETLALAFAGFAALLVASGWIDRRRRQPRGLS